MIYCSRRHFYAGLRFSLPTPRYTWELELAFLHISPLQRSPEYTKTSTQMRSPHQHWSTRPPHHARCERVVPSATARCASEDLLGERVHRRDGHG